MLQSWQVRAGVMGFALAMAGFAFPQASQDAAKSVGGTSGPFDSITLPKYAGEIPKGPNVQVYEKDCLICHSVRYVTMQPGFSRSTWEKEVKKMVDAYGATVPEDDQRKIVDYLVAVRGVSESKREQSGH